MTSKRSSARADLGLGALFCMTRATLGRFRADAYHTVLWDCPPTALRSQAGLGGRCQCGLKLR